ncbi:hypothetical protein P3383_04280 [Vibrio parahaemolyticus]|nr:hypothetical protein [Vibrio parahaemolyticus]HCG7136982.1 hypothetical protein [Vibrio parahaemolyticus]
MGIYELYSKRQKKLRGETPDVYTYEELPEALEVQITYIWHATIGNPLQSVKNGNVSKTYEYIVETLRKEYGVYELTHNTSSYSTRRHGDYLDELMRFFLSQENIESQLDVIELTFRVINGVTRSYEYLNRAKSCELADDAIKELNQRFREHGVGYQFEQDEIIKVNSQLLHSEAVVPALKLLNTKHYEGAQEEFLLAYEHYRHNRYKESINECLKAFESTMKSICDKRGWMYQANITAKGLIQICMDNELIPSFWQQQMTSLKILLESSVPTGRNKLSGHGQGSETTEIPEHLVAYMLHMTASTLVFLTNAELKVK